MSWRWPEIQLRPALRVAAAMLGLGLWLATAELLALRAAGDDTPWREPLFWEISGVTASFVALWIPLAAALNTTRPYGSWRNIALHLAAFVAYAVFKDTLMLGSRFLLYPILGWGEYQYPFWRVHLLMEAMRDGVSYTLIAVGFGLYRAWRDRQELDLRLKEARLQALLGQLNPHFLFNSLNTVSSLMYQDLERTDRLLADLGGVLRASFESDRPTWTLAEERVHTERFFALLKARFGDRVQLRWDVEPGLERASVPRFALQLLVENATKHNQDRGEPLSIAIRARRDGATVVLEVEDDGRGFAAQSPAAGAGVGLRHLEQALALLHGGAARLERGGGASGGARVRLVMPAEAS